MSSSMSIAGQLKISYGLGDVIILLCNEGYQHQHGDTAVCEASENWSEPFPVCKSMKNTHI